jgi:hypothetical protein
LRLSRLWARRSSWSKWVEKRNGRTETKLGITWAELDSCFLLIPLARSLPLSLLPFSCCFTFSWLAHVGGVGELESGFEGVILLLERCWPGRVRANKCTLYALCYGPLWYRGLVFGLIGALSIYRKLPVVLWSLFKYIQLWQSDVFCLVVTGYFHYYEKRTQRRPPLFSNSSVTFDSSSHHAFPLRRLLLITLE